MKFVNGGNSLNNLKEERALHIFALLSLVIYSSFSYFSHIDPRFSIVNYLIANTVLFLILALLFTLNTKNKIKLSYSNILIWAVLFRIAGLFSYPLYEDDFFRYLWDGYTFSQLGSPYGIAPSDFFSDESLAGHWQHILGQINYPDVATIYGPTLQYSFLLSNWLDEGNVYVLKGIYIVFDLLLIAILTQLADKKWVFLYAWNPLVLKEIAFTAHPDGFAVCLLMIGVFFFTRRHIYLSALFLALSVAAKIFALLIAPLILLKMNWRASVVFFCSLLALYMPFISQQQTDFIGLAAFANEWQFNSAIYALLTLFLPTLYAKFMLAICFLCFSAYYCWRYVFSKKDAGISNIPRGDILLGLFLFIAPVINAWYFLWVLPFAVLFPSFWPWLASYVLLFSYLIGLNLESSNLAAYQTLSWVPLFEYCAILLALIAPPLYVYLSKTKQP